MLKLTKRPKTPGITFKKSWFSQKGISYLQVILMFFWIKQTQVCFNLQRNGTENGLSNITNTIAESLQLQISLLHQGLCTSKTSLSSLSDGWAKHKEKVPDVSDSNENVKTTCNSKLKFTELKDLFNKRVQKSQLKMNYVFS